MQLAGTVIGQAAFDNPVRPAALCTGEQRNEVTAMNEVEEERDEMSGEEGTRLMAKRSWQRQIGE